MFKIGDFSKLSRVSVKTLRYYDEVGLLKPVAVDRFTGYRSYALEQLPRLNRILVLKDLGFSLEQIVQLLNEQVSADQMRGMLRMKQAEVRRQIAEEQARLARIEARLRQIEQEGRMPNYEVVIKKVEPQRVASVSGTIPNYEESGPIFDRLFDEVYGYVYQHGLKNVGCGIALYNDNGSMRNITVEAVAQIADPLSGSERIKVYDLPGVELMASAIHHGPFATLGQAYNAVISWINANGYRIAGPAREVYLQYERGGDQSKYVTEVQFPVEQA